MTLKETREALDEAETKNGREKMKRKVYEE